MTDRRSAQICDFGFPGSMSGQSRTIRYCAPELMSSWDDPTTSSDIYSLGCVTLDVGFCGPIPVFLVLIAYGNLVHL